MKDDFLKGISEKLIEIGKDNIDKNSHNYQGFQGYMYKAALYFIDAMFPRFTKFPEPDTAEANIRLHYLNLGTNALILALKNRMEIEEAKKITYELVEKIPNIYEILKTDIIAGYEGDPAAKNIDEIILAYPAFIAIGLFRIAHELYLLDCNIEARLITEYAHRKTGIDIHPGATIGKYFFIDHGTGVVIGETCVIGQHVKLYQHVTLGAKSFPVGEDGILVKGIKRHPNIGNNVVIYAGATILGGDVYIGDNSIIGGNVWLTHSVEEGSTVLQK